MMGEIEGWGAAEQAELKKVFYAGAREMVDDLQEALLKIESGGADEELMRSVKRFVHTLKGDSGSVGLTEVSNLCHRMEDVLALFQEALDHDLLELLISCVDVLRALLDENQPGNGVRAAHDLTARIEAIVKKSASAQPSSSKLALTEYQELMAREARSEGLTFYRLEAAFHPECREHAVGARMALKRLAEIGRVIQTLPDPDGDQIETIPAFFAVFATNRAAEEIVSAGVITGIISDLKVREYSGTEFAPGAETGVKAPDAPGALTAQASTFLRVEASRVDRLMNLVGELIIGRSMVGQMVEESKQYGATDATARLRDVNEYLERTISDIQKSVMRMRMVPVSYALRKLPRMVRDLSRAKGKPVRMEISGKETELDKGIVDGLNEPLMHIVRNMIDHGIEAPEQRRAAGKPEEGLILVRVYHEAAQVVIELSDDGRGIDTEKLKKKAVERQLLAPDEAARMQDSDAVNLVFLPGLSTADAVTETSGRGVGMDAVKSAVQNMRGAVEIASTPGKGTSLQMKLPLTLAVIKALLFQVGERLFALPLSAVLEIARINAGDSQTIDGKDALVIRDRVVSLVRMDRLFQMNPSGAERQYVLILNLGNRQTGLLVDRVVGQQDLVIKPLEESLGNLELVAGASILGDGKVILILDAAGVIRKAVDDERKRMAAA